MDEHKPIEPAVPAEPATPSSDADASAGANEAASPACELAQVESPALVPAMTGAAGVEAEPEVEAPKPAPSFAEIKSAAGRSRHDVAGILLVPAAEAQRASRRPRFPVIAGFLVAVLALGAIAGAVAMSATGSVAPAPAPVAAAAPVAPVADNVAKTDTASLHAEIAKLRSEVAGLKASLDSANRNANQQFAKLSDRIDHTQADVSARATKTADQLQKDIVTGSIPSAPAPAATVTVTPPPPPPPPPILPGWRLRDVYRGNAILQGRMGGMIELAPGDAFPGIGRVESIRRQDGRWVVITSRGMIVSMR
jgi:hypothetical protein